MKMLRITEYDQTIVWDTPLADYKPPNGFLRSLIADATKQGEAIHKDPEGCSVTAVVWDAE